MYSYASSSVPVIDSTSITVSNNASMFVTVSFIY